MTNTKSTQSSEGAKIVHYGSLLFNELQQVGEFGPGAPNSITVKTNDDESREIVNDAVGSVLFKEGYDANITIWRFSVHGMLWFALAAWYEMHPADLYDSIQNGSDKIRSAVIPVQEHLDDEEYVYFAAGSDGPIQELIGSGRDGDAEWDFSQRFVLIDRSPIKEYRRV